MVRKVLKKAAKQMGKSMYAVGMATGKAAAQAYGVPMDWSKEKRAVKEVGRLIRKRRSRA